MKKLSFLLAIILLLSAPLLTACKNDDEPKETTPQNQGPEVTTPEDVKPVVHASISRQQLTNYEIVAAKSSSEETDKLTKELQQAIQNAFNMPINLKTENAYNKKQYEILIGHTNREESETFLSSLKWDDYGYAIVGDKLIVAGKNEDGTLAALRAFLDYVNKHDAGEVFFSNADQLLVQTNYPHPSLTINGISVADLSIVCNEQELGGVAEIIRDAIIDACGIDVPIVTDDDVKSLENVILIGQTNQVLDPVPDGSVYSTGREYYINMLASGLFIDATAAAGYMSAAAMIAEKISTSQTEAITLECKQYDGKDAIAVMSFNLMAGKESSRLESVVGTILKYRPAVIGVQEATDMLIELLKQRLDGIYTIVGEGRNADGGGEHSAILYLTEEFECLESGTKWLSDTPDVPGSQLSSAKTEYPRIMTYALLSRKSDGKQFLHVNTHLDYGSNPEEEQVKVAQMQVVFNEIAKLPKVPTIITGDFNATVGSPVYNKVIAEGYSEAASHISAANRAPTYHGLMGTTGAPSHIDFIFSKAMESDCYYRICNERVDNENISDHYPILAVLSFKSEG